MTPGTPLLGLPGPCGVALPSVKWECEELVQCLSHWGQPAPRRATPPRSQTATAPRHHAPIIGTLYGCTLEGRTLEGPRRVALSIRRQPESAAQGRELSAKSKGVQRGGQGDLDLMVDIATPACVAVWLAGWSDADKIQQFKMIGFPKFYGDILVTQIKFQRKKIEFNYLKYFSE